MTSTQVPSNENHVFDRAGLAALSDLHSPRCIELTAHLEREQQAFLEHAAEFRSVEYRWPHDSLHSWSRIWEYPYVYHHMERLCAASPVSASLHAVDLGSGVTFFPFSVARLGCHVTCADLDPVCEKDLSRAIQVVGCKPGRVDFRLVNGPILPFHDREVDVLYCISVIEHIDRFERTFDEITRILKPEGILLLTFDLDLQGGPQLGISEYQRLLTKVKKHFTLVHPETTVHPLDMLRSSNGPYGFQEPLSRSRKQCSLTRKVIRRLCGRRPAPAFSYSLAVMGQVLKNSR
jgi:SAM-dependent methyltransferase